MQLSVIRNRSLFPIKNPPSGRTAKRKTLCYRLGSNFSLLLFMRAASIHDPYTNVKSPTEDIYRGLYSKENTGAALRAAPVFLPKGRTINSLALRDHEGVRCSELLHLFHPNQMQDHLQ